MSKTECSLKLTNKQFIGNLSLFDDESLVSFVDYCFRIARHPLFPLLALLLEKCEEATRGEVDTRVVLSSLENDVRAFIQHEKDGNKTLMTDDAEVDGLVYKERHVISLNFVLDSMFQHLDAESPASVADTSTGA